MATKSANRGFRKIRRKGYELASRMIHLVKPGRSPVVNEVEIRVAGLQRTGNHAIINWLYAQYPELKCYLNGVEANRNPFLTFSKKGTVRQFDAEFHKKIRIIHERLGVFRRKALLIYNFEDYSLEEVFSACFEKHHDRWVGASAKQFDVLVLRDPFNLFASRIRREEGVGGQKLSFGDPGERELLIALWKQYAREFLGVSNHLTHNKIAINYNKWFADKSYRAEVAGAFGLDLVNDSVDKVLAVGGGSSFDRTEFDRNASTMKVLERWRNYKDDAFFRELFTDTELLELSSRIFGNLPGVEELLPKSV